MSGFNVFMAGVGGQGIGMLSEVLLRAADRAGLPVRAVDTHGLAQRGGMVVSHLRIGASAHSPLIATGSADLVAALERHEALRALRQFARSGGSLIYYDTAWQPLAVRMAEAQAVTGEQIAAACQRRSVRCLVARREDLADVRMQNIVLLAGIAARGLVPDIAPEHYRKAMADLMPDALLKVNLDVFEKEMATVAGS